MNEETNGFSALVEEMQPQKEEPVVMRKRAYAPRHQGVKNRQAVLAYLIAMPGCTQSDISRHVDINAGYVSNIVRPLVKLGIIKSKDDRRLYFFNQAIPDQSEPRKIVQRGKWLTLAEFGALAGCTDANGIHLINSGRIIGRKEQWGKRWRWLVSEESVNNYLSGPRTYKKHTKRVTPARLEQLKNARANINKGRTDAQIKALKKARVALRKYHASRRAKKQGLFSRLFGG